MTLRTKTAVVVAKGLVLSAIPMATGLTWANGLFADEHQTNANIVRMVSGTHSFYEEDGTTLRGARILPHDRSSRRPPDHEYH